LRQQRLAELGIVGEIDAPARIAATCLEGIDLTLLHGGRQSREVAPDLLALRVMRFAQLAVKLPEERAQVQRFVEVRRQELEHGHAAVQVGRCRAALGRVTLRTLKLGRAALRALEVVAEQGREDLLAYVHVGFFALVEELGVGLEPAVPQRPYVRCSTLVGVALRLALAEVIGDPGERERNGERSPRSTSPGGSIGDWSRPVRARLRTSDDPQSNPTRPLGREDHSTWGADHDQVHQQRHCSTHRLRLRHRHDVHVGAVIAGALGACVSRAASRHVEPAAPRRTAARGIRNLSTEPAQSASGLRWFLDGSPQQPTIGQLATGVPTSTGISPVGMYLQPQLHAPTMRSRMLVTMSR
jgi:hypothetical protein